MVWFNPNGAERHQPTTVVNNVSSSDSYESKQIKHVKIYVSSNVKRHTHYNLRPTALVVFKLEFYASDAVSHILSGKTVEQSSEDPF